MLRWHTYTELKRDQKYYYHFISSISMLMIFSKCFYQKFSLLFTEMHFLGIFLIFQFLPFYLTSKNIFTFSSISIWRTLSKLLLLYLFAFHINDSHPAICDKHNYIQHLQKNQSCKLKHSHVPCTT